MADFTEAGRPVKRLGEILRDTIADTQEISSKLQWVDTCLTILSESIAALPCKLLRKRKDGGWEPAKDHPLYTILRHEPNSYMTAIEFFERIVREMLGSGNSYFYVNRVSNEVREILPLPNGSVRVEQDQNWQIQYYLMTDKGETVTDRDNILHFLEYAPNGFKGISRLARVARAYKTAEDAEKRAESFMKDGISHGSYLHCQQPQSAEKIENFKTNFADSFAGAVKAGKTPILSGGWEFRNTNISAQDMELLEVRRFNRDAILAAFRIPPVIAQNHEKNTSWGAGVEQTFIGYKTFTLQPLATKIEQRLNRILLLPHQRDLYKIRFTFDSQVRGDTKSRYESYAKALAFGWLTVNEIREMENMPALEGGDKSRVPVNTQPIDENNNIDRQEADNESI